MVITWQLEEIKSIDPNTMGVRIIELVDGVEFDRFQKQFAKSLTAEQVLTQLAQLVKQRRQKDLDDQLPFISLDLSDFEARIAAL